MTVGVAIDGSGNIYVGDYNNTRVQKFDASFAFVTAWGTLGSGDGQFNSIFDLTCDLDGNVFVADYSDSRI